MTSASGRLDRSAIVRSAGSMSILVLPLAVLDRWVTTTDDRGAASGFDAVFFVSYLVCAAIAGFGASKLAERREAEHGAATGASLWLIVQAIGALWKAVSGRGAPSIVAMLAAALLMATCGMIGGLLERRTRTLRG